MYVFDTCSFSAIFKFYPKRFPTLWKQFDELVKNGSITSVRESRHELQNRDKSIIAWIENNKSMFHEPSDQEILFVKDELFTVKNGHFLNMVETDKLLKGGFCADPFIIARAKIKKSIVITEESLKPNSAKIPSVCQHFGVQCYNLEKFMENEKWEF